MLQNRMVKLHLSCVILDENKLVMYLYLDFHVFHVVFHDKAKGTQ